MNLKDLSLDLANKLANSFYDREPERPVFFTSSEIEVIEEWLRALVTYELMKD